MNHKDNLAAIVKACQPQKDPIYCTRRRYLDDGVHVTYKCPDCGQVWGEEERHPACLDVFNITLPDVLLALGKTGTQYYLRDDGEVFVWHTFEEVGGHSTGVVIDLRANLSGWSKEAVAALAAILGKNA